tara:strand:+ start:30 stop:605 length:576 start_codon:yes stop_codon:yes gene_type:complete
MLDNKEHILWSLFIEGDKNAFSAIFKMHYSSLYNYGIKICGNTHLVEDVLQSFFINLFENRKRIGEVSNVKGYIFISYRRALFAYLKKESIFTEIKNDTHNRSNFEISPEEIHINQDFSSAQKETISKILNTLAPREREVIYLKYYSELETSEISNIMDISYQSVLNTLQKAFTKLRKEVENAVITAILKK